MSVLSECPYCHKKQAVKNKLCQCGADLDKLKRSKKVKFWIDFRDYKEGKQRRKYAGYSLSAAIEQDKINKEIIMEKRAYGVIRQIEIKINRNIEIGNLSDNYIRKRLMHAGVDDPSDNLIKLKRSQIALKRGMKNLKEWKKENA